MTFAWVSLISLGAISPLAANDEETTEYFTLQPEARISINAPARIDSGKKTCVIFYALPNGNSIEQTAGRHLKNGDDWHFDIQHIAAQTRFLRQALAEKNIVVVYLEAHATKIGRSWPAWRKEHGDAPITNIVNTILQRWTGTNVEIVLSGHSGGGSFIFGYLNDVAQIPDNIVRIAFLDSNYAYDRTRGHEEKLCQWLRSGTNHSLCVLAYDDYTALSNGKHFVSSEGGTWGRSHAMLKDLGECFPITGKTNAPLETYGGLDGRVEFLLTENPEKKILHTVQVERNGFIEVMLSGTTNQGKGYQYFGERAYAPLIRD